MKRRDTHKKEYPVSDQIKKKKRHKSSMESETEYSKMKSQCYSMF